MKKTSKKIIVANWKMNPANPAAAKEIFSSIRRVAEKLKRVETVVCPPAVYLGVLKAGKKLSLGAQNCFYKRSGSYTGEISADMIKNAGGSFVIIGHSERRTLGETDEAVAAKVSESLSCGLSVILCVGERERSAHGEYLAFIKDELHADLAGVSRAELSRVIIAYEPIWAIGKSDKDAMKPADIHQMVIFIRRVISDMLGRDGAKQVPVLYGGSVSARIAEDILFHGKADGLLVGRQSLDPREFGEILKIAEGVK